MIAKLVKAGYLRPEHLRDADAITSAIASMKQALRSGGGDDKSPSVLFRTTGLDRSALLLAHCLRRPRLKPCVPRTHKLFLAERTP